MHGSIAGALRRHHHHHVLVGQLPVVPRRHRLEELRRLEQHLAEPERLVERAARVDVRDAEGDVVHALRARLAGQRPPEPRPLDQLELAAPRVGDVRDVERDVVRHHRALERRHQRRRAGGDEARRARRRRRARGGRSRRSPTSPQPWPAGTGRRPVAVEHLDELDPARADRRRAAVREHRDAGAAPRPAVTASSPRHARPSSRTGRRSKPTGGRRSRSPASMSPTPTPTWSTPRKACSCDAPPRSREQPGLLDEDLRASRRGSPRRSPAGGRPHRGCRPAGRASASAPSAGSGRRRSDRPSRPAARASGTARPCARACARRRRCRRARRLPELRRRARPRASRRR